MGGEGGVVNAPVRAPECPAAHSMDTTWFAIDADGHVAAFETGEAGALPVNATMGPEGGDFDSWPLELAVAVRALADGTFPEADDDLPPPTYAQEVVLVLEPDADEAPTTYRDAAGRPYSVHERLGDGWLVLRDAEPRVVASTEAVPPARLAELAEDVGVTRVVLGDEIVYWREDGGGALYRFANDDYGNPGAYRRQTDPIDPLTVDDLTDELRAKISKLKIDVRFAEAPDLHLADHFADDECETYGDTNLRGESPPDAPAPGSARGMDPRRARLILLAVFAFGTIAALYWLLR